jgi:DNA-binding MarR family transcriptional regulator
MENNNKINDVLVKLINDIWILEKRALVTEEFEELTANDFHVIEAIGLGKGDNMGNIAKRLNVTVGTLTTNVNSLVNKKYAKRSRSQADRRVVYVKLTPKVIKAYEHHEQYHNNMTQAIVGRMTEEELPVLEKMLDSLAEFFESNAGEVVKGKKAMGKVHK